MNQNEKIARKLETMKKYVNFLKSNSKVSEAELENNYVLRCAIERNFQLAIECVLDIGERIISIKNFEKAEDYKSIIIILGKHNVLPESFATKFSKSAGLRNILVHMYEEVNLHELYTNLKNLDDFDNFAKYIARYTEKKML